MIDRRELLRKAGTAAAALPVLAGAAAARAWADPAGTKDPSAKSEKPERTDRSAEKPQPITVGLEFQQELDSRTAKKGDQVALKVVDDVTVDGKLRFRQGAEANGIVEDVDPPGRFGKPAQIHLRLDWVKDINGEHVPLRSYHKGGSWDAKAGGASLGGALLLGPLGLAGGALIKGKQITIRKGARIKAQVLPAGQSGEESRK